MARIVLNAIILSVIGAVGLAAILVGVVVLKFGLRTIGLTVIGDVPTNTVSDAAGWILIITGIASNIAMVAITFFRVKRIHV